MIYGKISDIQVYRNISRWFSYAADFLEKTDLSALPPGRCDIQGGHVFINVMEADTKEEDEVQFEIHKKYWDVQIDIEGVELVQIGLDAGSPAEAFREDIDFGTCECREWISSVMGPGRFIVCMAQEPHKPT